MKNNENESALPSKYERKDKFVKKINEEVSRKQDNITSKKRNISRNKGYKQEIIKGWEIDD